ncbi:MAG: hypothetical protein ACR2PB_12380 [Desulfocapsaceae bacterium]
MIASHYDSVKDGGDFDGIAGIELVRHFREEWPEYGDFIKAIEVLSDTIIENNY